MQLFIRNHQDKQPHFQFKYKMKKLSFLISLGFCSNFLFGQTDYEWSVGVTYKPFTFTLLNDDDDRNEQFQQIDNNLNGNNYFGITGNYHFYNRIFVGAGLGYSKQTFHYKYTSQHTSGEQPIFFGRGNLNLKYIHLPMRVGYQLSANHLDFMGIRFSTALIPSYNVSYDWEHITYYYTDFPVKTINFDQISSHTIRTSTTGTSTTYSEDGEIRFFNETSFRYPINRWNLGIQTGADIYFIISQTVNINIGMWYNYDLLRTESKDMATYTSSGKRPHDEYSHNQRVGLSVGLEWLIF
jgi:hypothetical protein